MPIILAIVVTVLGSTTTLTTTYESTDACATVAQALTSTRDQILRPDNGLVWIDATCAPPEAAQ